MSIEDAARRLMAAVAIPEEHWAGEPGTLKH